MSLSTPMAGFRSRVAFAASGGLVLASLTLLGGVGPAHAADPVTIQILGSNDFHGRLLSANDAAGAAQFAGAVQQLRSENPNTVFAMAGDIIGASTFESFIQKDKPTLDVMNAAGLQVSAAGNHEFDQGYDDLANRVMKPFDATTNPQGGADWQYLAANVRKKSDDSYALPDVAASLGDSDGATWTTTVDGVTVGFVGAVTEDLPSLVSPAGIADLEVTSIIDEVNTAADRLKADGADLVVMLVHEGAACTALTCSTDDSAFGKIVAGVNSNVNAIVSGHTHLAYKHVIGGRPVVSAGQYGMNLDKLIFEVDPDSGTATFTSADVVATGGVEVTDPDAVALQTEVAGIVTAAQADAEELGSVELGKLAGPLKRAFLADGVTENRGGESTLGNVVAEAQRAAGKSQIAFMNPGGLRTDMVGNDEDGFPATLTYKQAAVVQPFANTLVNMSLTGAQIKKVLEQQWQRDASGNVPTRPFLRLGTSNGFTFTYDPARAEGDRITGMWLDGVALVDTTKYSVTVNSFLSSGGDNFFELAHGTDRTDTGQTDLQAMVDFMARYESTPLAVDYAQHAVGVSFPQGSPSTYGAGDLVGFDLSSLMMTAPGELRDRTVQIRFGDQVIGRAVVDNTVGADPDDESGWAMVDVRLPAYAGRGRPLTVTAPRTGTMVRVPIALRNVAGPKVAAKLKVKITPKKVRVKKTRAKVVVTVRAQGGAEATGKVRITVRGQQAKTIALKNGRASLKLKGFKKPGKYKVKIRYAGDAAVKAATATKTLKVVTR